MRSMVLIVLCVTLQLTRPVRSQAQWIQTQGPYGGEVHCFAVDGENLFAGTSGGVFRSTNNGASWSAASAGLTGSYLNALAVSGPNLFAGFGGPSGGVFRSTNNGTSWTAVNNGLTNPYVGSLAVKETNLFAATSGPVTSAGGGIHVSTNSGTSWSAANAGLPPNSFVHLLAVAGADLFAVMEDGKQGASLWTYNGTSWTAINTSLPFSYVNAHCLVANGTGLYAASSGSAVYRSTDKGASWTANNIELPPYYHGVRALATCGTDLYAGLSGSGVFLSTNNGATWSAASTGLTDTYVGALAVKDTNVFAGTSEGGVFLSTNNGVSWSAANTGLTSTYVRAITVAPDSLGGTNVFAGTLGGGAFRSTNNGTSWSAVNAGLPHKYVTSFAVKGKNLFVGTIAYLSIAGAFGGGMFLSSNNGTSWSDINTGLEEAGYGGRAINALAVKDTNLFAGAAYGGVYLSTNNGTSWSGVNNGLPDYYHEVVTFAVNGMNVFTGISNWEGGPSVYLSTNNGTSWTPVNNGLTGRFVLALAASGTNLFAGTSSGGVFLSTNSGASWTAVNTGLPSNLYDPLEYSSVSAFAVSGTSIFASADDGQGGGVYLSTNNGTSWNAVSTGLRATGVSALALSPDGAGSTNLYVGTSGAGVWRRPLSEMITTAVRQDNAGGVPKELLLDQNYPNPFNPATRIGYQTPITGFVTLKVFDVLGREVRTLVNEELRAGSYETTFNAEALASGVYYYQLRARESIMTKRLLLLR